MAGRISQFEDPAVAAGLLRDLGRRVCRYDRRAGADILRSAFRLASAPPGAGTATGRLLHSLRAALRQCDPESAAEAEARWGVPTDGPLAAAEEFMLVDPAEAAAVLAAAAGDLPHLGPEAQADFLMRLLDLRRRDEEAADTIFLRALDAVAVTAEAPVETLSLLGAYVFPLSSKQAAPILRARPAAGRHVYDFGATPSSEKLAAAYLRTAGALVRSGRLEGPPRARQVLLHRLLRKAEGGAPAEAPLFEQQAAAVRRPAPLEPDVPAMHPADLARLLRFRTAWIGSQWGRAREIAAEIEDEELRNDLEALLAYAGIRRLLETGDLNTAMGLAGQFPPGPLRALLYLGAGACAPPEQGRGYLLAALDEARKARGALPPFFFRLVASELSEGDPDLAFTVLEEMFAVREEADRNEKEEEDQPRLGFAGGKNGIYVMLRNAPSGQGIRVTPPCVESLGLPELLLRLAERDEARAETLALRIPPERERGTALVKLAARRLRRAFETRSASGAPERPGR